MTDTPEEIEVEASPIVGAAFRDARFSSADRSMIDMELDHPKHGWIPITINAEEYPEVWADVVTAGDIGPYVASSEEDLRAQWRASATLRRGDFCKALEKRRILPLEDAVAAAKGDWPDAFNPLLSQIEDPADALITWATAQTIERLHPLFEAVREFYQMTPEEADAMFGYEAPLD